MLPKSTLAAKNDSVLCSKLAMDRLTVAVCSNVTGSDKMPLSIIGKI